VKRDSDTPLESGGAQPWPNIVPLGATFRGKSKTGAVALNTFEIAKGAIRTRLLSDVVVNTEKVGGRFG